MSQDKILRLLEKEKRPLSVKEITEKLELTTVGKSLYTLRKHSEVKWVWMPIKFKVGKGFLSNKPILHYFV